MKRDLIMKSALGLIAIFLAINVLVSRGSSAAANATQPKVEYKVFTVSSSATASEVERILNEQGQMGWDLIQVAFLPTGGFPPSNATTLIFRKK